MNGILSFTRWEMKNSLRFPLPELIVFIVFFTMFSKLFVIPIGMISGEGELSSIANGGYFTMFMLLTPERVQLLYTIIIVFSSFMLALSFANDMEKGILRQYFSSPISKKDIFFGKIIAVSLPLIAVSSIATISMLFMIDPAHFFSTPHVLKFMVAILFAYTALVLFIVGVSTIISLITKNTAVTAISTFMLFYLFDMISSRELPFFPSRSMADIVYFVVGQSYNNLAVLFMPMMAAVTIGIGYYLFVARVELS